MSGELLQAEPGPAPPPGHPEVDHGPEAVLAALGQTHADLPTGPVCFYVDAPLEVKGREEIRQGGLLRGTVRPPGPRPPAPVRPAPGGPLAPRRPPCRAAGRGGGGGRGGGALRGRDRRGARPPRPPAGEEWPRRGEDPRERRLPLQRDDHPGGRRPPRRLRPRGGAVPRPRAPRPLPPRRPLRTRPPRRPHRGGGVREGLADEPSGRGRGRGAPPPRAGGGGDGPDRRAGPGRRPGGPGLPPPDRAWRGPIPAAPRHLRGDAPTRRPAPPGTATRGSVRSATRSSPPSRRSCRSSSTSPGCERSPGSRSRTRHPGRPGPPDPRRPASPAPLHPHRALRPGAHGRLAVVRGPPGWVATRAPRRLAARPVRGGGARGPPRPAWPARPPSRWGASCPAACPASGRVPVRGGRRGPHRVGPARRTAPSATSSSSPSSAGLLRSPGPGASPGPR